MEQRVLCHFGLVVAEKFYQFSFQPSVVTFDDLDNALAAFKSELEVLKQKALEEQQAAANQSSNENQPASNQSSPEQNGSPEQNSEAVS